jgi:RNA polymerase sigma factor (sigma-70 family)
MRPRPDRDELSRAAVELLSTGSGRFKATARRFSLCDADAEDAYQHGLETLLTKAPTPNLGELKPWLHTVIKHEALLIRRQRERMLGASVSSTPGGFGLGPEERAPEKERARRTAEALAQLKPGEVECLLLKALGYSYDEIAEKTGFSFTKVNRCLTEGRKRFFERFAQIESGQRCTRLRGLLLADGEHLQGTEEHKMLKTHLRTCASCRAALRDYRSLPPQLAELLPPALLADSLDERSPLARIYDTAGVWVAERVAGLGHKLQAATEALSAQKATAVVASTAALTGGAVVHEKVLPDQAPHRHHANREVSQDRPAEAQTAPAGSGPASTAGTDRRLASQMRTIAATDPAQTAAAREFDPQPTSAGPITSASGVSAASRRDSGAGAAGSSGLSLEPASGTPQTSGAKTGSSGGEFGP